MQKLVLSNMQYVAITEFFCNASMITTMILYAAVNLEALKVNITILSFVNAIYGVW